MDELSLNTPIEYLNGLGTEKAKLIKSHLNIYTCEDFLNYFPFRYIDKSKIYLVSQINNSSTIEIQLKGRIIDIKEKVLKKRKTLSAIFEDSSGKIELVWFKYTNWFMDSIPLNVEVLIFGKINKFNGLLTMAHPEVEKFSEVNFKNVALDPVYSNSLKIQKRGINQRFIKKIIKEILDKLKSKIFENFSEPIIKNFRLISRVEAYQEIHFPTNYINLQKAEYRIKFEEIFFFQLGLSLQKLYRKSTIPGTPFPKVGNYFNNFYTNHLPFPLTSAQKKVIKEIRNDLKKNVQMNRLLQGDVGSGKTIVALLCMLLAMDNNFQACMLAPTEILITQHYNSIVSLLKDFDITIELLTGSTTSAKRKQIFNDLESGKLNILLGTHAILEDKVKFKKLSLAIVDEQHRFGVEQRSKLWKKNTIPPHILVMTATPIPRTLAMSYYSDLDVSIIDELPQGRKPIKTFYKMDSDRLAVFGFVKEQIKIGRQVYFVYPLIEESEVLNYKDLMDGYESITRSFPMPEYQVSIVHGKMNKIDRDFEMNRFLNGETQIMVATTVIEVGVNVPNATVMVIESAEKFGLSQLHQLRGRVGRGFDQSYCILMIKSELSPEAQKRILTMCETNDGFKIAEADLEIRGPGNILGTQQSGNIEFKKINLLQDKDIVSLSKSCIDHLLLEDPKLQLIKNEPIKNFFIKNYKNKFQWSIIS
ncbi:ATP-dependent DNA helicase RecG [Apibacter muscae]|uniref:ATP-dependent DNA helicase RecG n=1 Tax=Apibacter muscae TaxID=2509004 RepID=A0A563DC57_9FLAO|nr:ATP-dependent DNA helicase RecG [Apibacter muscae]TWP27805.1 ATP-dependent DNA helicase RecG [Apibacter muscae]